MIRSCGLASISLSILCLAPSLGHSQVWDRPIAPGLLFRMEAEQDPPRTIYGLRYDPKLIRAESRLAGGGIYEPGPMNGRNTVTDLVRQANAQAGFNGDFFQWTPDPGGDPQGFMMHGGELLSLQGNGPRGAAAMWGPGVLPQFVSPTVGITVSTLVGELQPSVLNGKVSPNGLGLNFDVSGEIYGHAPITVVRLALDPNRPRRDGKTSARVLSVERNVVRTTIAKGTAVLGGAGEYADRLAAFVPGTEASITVTLRDLNLESTEAMGGGPMLLRGGIYAGPAEGAAALRHPRTAIGTTAEGYVWAVVIDGRQSMSVGATFRETAEVMRRWGCVDALNLDGGGSSAIHAMGVTLNRPSAGTERSVANGVVLFVDKVQTATGALSIEVPESIPVGSTIRIAASSQGEAIPSTEAVFAAQGAAWIDQEGDLHPIEPGIAEVIVWHRGRTARSRVRIVSQQDHARREFRVLPYLQEPGSTQMRITWFSETGSEGSIVIDQNQRRPIRVRGERRTELGYGPLEESQRDRYPMMRSGNVYKHSTMLRGLKPDTIYTYTVRQGESVHSAEFRTLPSSTIRRPIRFIAFADSETEPEGRTSHRSWMPGTQAEGSTGRPARQQNYLVTEAEGFTQNLKLISNQKPDFVVLAGDLVQGGGLQRAWDEFFHHLAGSGGDLMSRVPLIPAFGNWECFGAANGGYDPEAVHWSRRKFLAYFDGPSNGTPAHQNVYHRLDLGPVTLITLDSSNGLPDNTDADTNRNIDAALYPGQDLADISPGSIQYRWAEAQLRDARRKGQIIFVQFHHIPYSSGGHSLPLTAPGSSGQAGIPMRAYTAMFQKYGVVAVLCGHNESFERSQVGNVMFYDAGVAGDGLGFSLAETDPRFRNPYRKWVAHVDEPELWNGLQLLSGGKHYGHLQIDLQPLSNRDWKITFTPVYCFPVTDVQGRVTGFERRTYRDVVEGTIRAGRVTWSN